MVKRSAFTHCHWCGRVMCHDCRRASVDKPAKCGGHNQRPCPKASSRDHLLPKKDRRKDNNPIVVACRKCNTRRGHDDWTPYEELEVEPFRPISTYPISEIYLLPEPGQ